MLGTSLGYQAPAVAGAVLSVAGLAILGGSLALHKRHVAQGIAAE